MTSFTQRPECIPIAIVGMACKLPGADNLEEYWKLLIEGRSAVVELPPDRLDQDLYYDSKVGVLGKTYSKLGALISSREVQHSECPIPEELARIVDPAHLLMCGVAGSALRHAGMDPFNLPESLCNCGVFIGHAQGSNLGGDYTYATCIEEAAEFLRDSEQFQLLTAAEQQSVIQDLVDDVRSRMPRRTLDAPDVSASMVAGAISKAFQLTGPFAAINSACASSLQSILLGARSLQLGHVDMAIVGGASDCKSDTLVLFSHARAMSTTGSRPFDAEADGLICGEGYAAIVLKTLPRALADGDRVHAVVRGLGISSDGKGKSLWAPRKEGQIKAMERAYRTGIDISKLQYLEAHSTATQLGDATELNTLTEILSQHFPPGKKIPVTSVKANIGHSLETAGIASVIKTVLCMQHQMVSPAINIRQLNPKIDWDTAPIYVPTAPEPWPAPDDGSPRLAGVNAFGIGGLNMHVVLEEFIETSRLEATSVAPDLGPAVEQDAVAVIGMGCVLPGAGNIDDYWELLRSGRDPKIPAPADRLRYALLPNGPDGKPLSSAPVGGFINDFEYDWRRHKVPPKQIAQADPLQFMFLDAADQALNDAGYDQKPFDRSRVGVLVGTEFGGDFSFQLQMGLRLPEMRQVIERSLASRKIPPQQAKLIVEQFSKILLERWPALIDETGSFSTSSLASRIGKTWNLMGGAAALDAGEASSLAAIGISVDMLLAGDCDMMICAAGQRRMGLPEYECMALGGVLGNGAAQYSPLDARGKSFVSGEGVGVVLLKRLSDARRDGDRIRVIIKGIGTTHHETWEQAVRLAMEQSFQQCDVSPDKVAVIELDALTRESVDQQLQAISAVQDGYHRNQPLMVGSVASQIGFTRGASGMASLLKAVLEMEHGQVLPTLGVEVPAAVAAQQPETLRIVTDRLKIPRLTESGKLLASVISYGRGMACHLVCESDSPSTIEVQKVGTTAGQSNGALVEANLPLGAPQQTDRLSELASFLINFVVEQTGYPAEVVELDADLEADLGIDSIKKAQLFGELQEYFDVTPNNDLSLDDFPTLRHVLNFLASNAAGQTPTQEASLNAPPLAPEMATATSAAQFVESPPAEAATQRSAPQETASTTVPNEQLEAFLINFVVEQTGYPAEVVELDADLEADLGIDSIKKAQLFGELQEYFDVTPSDDLTLDDFPTLRHVLNYLASSGAAASAVESVTPTADTRFASKTTAPEPVPVAVVQTPPAQTASPLAAEHSAENPWRIVRFGAETLSALLSQLTTARANCSNYYSTSPQAFTPRQSVRLAIVADSPDALDSKLQILESLRQDVASWSAFQRQGIFFCESIEVTRPRIAFFFPGQGSQYEGMLRDLVQSNQAAAAAMREADAALLQLGSPTFAEMAWTASNQLGSDPWTTQASMMVANHVMHSVLRAEGILPDLAAGHSYGEYCALVATGAWSLAQALTVTRARCAGIESCKSAQGGLLATTATPDQAKELFAGLNAQVHVATHNAPNQTVVGGGLDTLHELSQRLASAGFQSRRLEVPCPFHTPLMVESCGPLRDSLRTADIRQPSVTTFSLVTNREVNSPEEIRANLEAHMTRPQFYVDVVRMIADERPTVFVEVGPQQHLTRLNEQILSGMEARFIASDNPKGSALEQVCRVRALLECCDALALPVAATPIAKGGTTLHEIVRYDATQRRKERLRRSAGEGVKPLSTTTPTPQHDDSLPLSQALLWDPSAATPNGSSETAVTSVNHVSEVSKPPEMSVGVSNVATPESDTSTPLQEEPPAVTQESIVVAPATDPNELEAFLINFVVEQTGYPAEVVELDADLEADLGIDSIKKAQLFGELQEYFDVTPSDDLTLDDFPTLRHVLEYLSANMTGEAVALADVLPERPSAEAPELHTATVPAAHSPTRTQLTVTESTMSVRTVQLAGTAYEMGVKHGQELRLEIRRALYRLADLANGEVDEPSKLLKLAEAPERFFSEDQLAELGGIAEAVEVPVENLIALNLSLLADVGSSSTQFAIEVEKHGRAVRQGLRDELLLNSALSDCLVLLVQIRKPSLGTASVTVTFAGCVGALAGLNAEGLAVTSGMMLGAAESSSPVEGPRHTLLARQLLEQASNVPTAIAELRLAPASLPWNMVLSSADHRPCVVEYDGQSLEILEDAVVLAANHRMLSTAESSGPESSLVRLKRLRQFLTGSSHSQADLQMALTSHGIKSDRQLCVLIDHSSGDLAVYYGSTDAMAEKNFCHFDVPNALSSVVLTIPDGRSQNGERLKHDFVPVPYNLEDDQQTVTKRYVMRIIDVAWPDDVPQTPTLNGSALVIGDNASADALADQLRGFGTVVHRLSLTGSRQAAIEHLEKLCSSEPVPHLFLMSSRDERQADYNDPDSWNQVFESQVLAPFFLCQRWVQLASSGKWLDKCTIIAVTNCRGDFGLSGDVPTPETGAITGLMKALYLELNVMAGNSSFWAKAIDSPHDEPPETLARFICRELASRSADFEVSYVRGTRYLQVAIPREAEVKQYPENPPRGNWVVTGGARGITAECARELGKRFGVKLHLIGTSPLPQIDSQWRDLDEGGLARLRTETILQARAANEKLNEAWDKVHKQIEIDRTLHNFSVEGLQAYYYSCDVSDRDALGRVLDEIRRQHGPIEGVLHGAGIERSCRFEKKHADNVLATLGAKVLGAWHLMMLTKNDPVRHFIGFGSVSGRMGSYGQADYCVASDMLCKLVSWYGNQHDSCHAVAFHWHPWDEVGMAYRPEMRSFLEDTSGLKLMPKREGLRHFLRELYAGQADSELLVTEPAYHQRYYPGNIDVIADMFKTGKKLEFPARMPEQVASRHVMRMKAAPLDTLATSRVALTDSAYILGDNADALALRDQLTASGVAVQMLSLEEDQDKVLAHLENVWQSQPARSLFLMTGRDREALQLHLHDAFQSRMSRSVYLPFQVAQRWFQLVSEMPFDEPATLVAATSLGGDFGFSGQVVTPEGGALCGLLKSVYVEDARFDHARFRVKLIDSPSDEAPQDLATAICSELASGLPEVEVGWSRGVRQKIECVPAPVEQLPQQDLPRGGTWVVTGGGRGITAYAALHLAQRYGLKVHLIGKSSLPDDSTPWLRCSEEEVKRFKAAVVREAIAAGHSPEGEWDKIRKCREIVQELSKYVESGVETQYHSCDIADENALAAVLETIRRTDGPIEGIIHGAGYAKAARFESCVGDRLRLTFGPKADGTLALMRLTKNDPLRYFLAFGSLSGRYGGNGLCDYASANDMLAKLCGWFRKQRPECATTCFHWQTWNRIGMAMLADAGGITKSSFKMEFMQPEEGFEHFHREVRAGAPEAEVLVADGYFERAFYSYPVIRSEAEEVPSSDSNTGRPLIDSMDIGPDGLSGLATVRFDPTRDPFLLEHRLKQDPFLPGVIGLESLLEAATLLQPGQFISEVKDVKIVNGLRFQSAEPIATQVRLSRSGESVESRLFSELRNRAGQIIDPNRLHVSASVLFGTTTTPIEAAAPGIPPLGWHPFVYSDDGLLYHGPPLRCLKQFAFQYDGGWGQIIAPPLAELAGPRSEAGWILPTAVLDACVVCCGSFVFLQFGGQLEVPHGFEQIRWSRQPKPGEICVARFYFRGRESRHSQFDFSLFGEDEQPLLQAIGYRTIRVGGNNS